MVAQRLELKYLELFFLGSRTHRVGFGAGLFRRTEYAGDFIAAREKSIQYCFTKILLSDYCYFHIHSPSRISVETNFCAAKVTSELKSCCPIIAIFIGV